MADRIIGQPIIFDVACTSTPTPLWPTPLLFTGWLTCPANNGGNVTLTCVIFGVTMTASRSATQGDYLSCVDLNQILVSGAGNAICVSGNQ